MHLNKKVIRFEKIYNYPLLSNPSKQLNMMTTTWRYLLNPFDNATKRNFKLMNLLATDHHDKLKSNVSNPIIADLYQKFFPVYSEYKTLYIQMAANAGRYQSHTKQVGDLLQDLSGQKIKRWDIKIQNEYLDDTREYSQLLPNGRAPFQRGAYENRIKELWALADKLHDFVNLHPIELEVRQFATDLENARTMQQGFERASTDYSRTLEAKRVELAKMMHLVFASLMVTHIDNLSYVETYYDLQYLHSTSSSTSEDTPDDGDTADDGSSNGNADDDTNAQPVL